MAYFRRLDEQLNNQQDGHVMDEDSNSIMNPLPSQTQNNNTDGFPSQTQSFKGIANRGSNPQRPRLGGGVGISSGFNSKYRM